MRKWIYLCSAIAAVVVGVAVGVMEVSPQPAVRRTSQLKANAPTVSKATAVSAWELRGRYEPHAPWCPARSPRARTTVVIAIDPSPPYFSRRCYYVVAGRHLIIKIHDPGFKLHGLVISPWRRPAFFLYDGVPVMRIGATTIESGVNVTGGSGDEQFQPHQICSRRIIKPGIYAVQGTATPLTAIATLVVQRRKA
jgi:hypothetical protein